MTDHNEAQPIEPLTIGGKVLYRWLFTERGRLARRLAEQFGRDIGPYRQLPSDELVDTISPATEENLRVFAESLRDRVTPSLPDLTGPITASAARRAGEGLPLDAVMSAYGMGMLETWRALVAGARPEDLDDVMACTELVLGYLQRACTAVAAAYLDERRRMESDEQQRRYTLMSALLRGEPLVDPARQAGIRLPPRYLVLCVTFARHQDEEPPGVGATMAAQRKVYRADEELERSIGEPVLSLLDTNGGTVLLPAAAPGDLDADGLVARMGLAVGVEVIAAGVLAEPDQVAEAAAQAQEILELARAFGRGPGYYRLADVLLEYQLTRPTAARSELSALLAPLDDHPDLLLTLDAYLRLGLNRRRTATQLHVHPNTVDYRLRKAIALTGLDPGDPAQLQRIGAALAIRRFSRGHLTRD